MEPFEGYLSSFDEQVPSAGDVVVLTSDLDITQKLSQTAKNYHFRVFYKDKADTLTAFTEGKKVVLIIIDFSRLEAEGFKLLSRISRDERFRKTHIVGYVTQTKADIKREAQSLGCERVFGKTEFFKEMDSILTRCVG